MDMNNLSSANGSQQTVQNSINQDSVFKTTAWFLAYGVIGIITILGNSLTIAVLTRKRFQRKKLHYLLINLAITDLTVGLISVPLMMTVFLSELYNFQIPKSLHDVHYFFDVLSGLTSMYSIAFIAVERLLVVCWPFKQNLLRLWHYALAISLTWLVAATVAIVSHQILPDRISHMEGLNFRTVFAVLPIIVTVAAYCFLWYTWKNREVQFQKCNYKKTIASTLLIVTVAFVCLWSPFIILVSTVGYLSYPYFRQCCSLTLDGFIFALYFTKLMQYSNSCVNPFIYALRMKSFRTTALEIFGCFKKR